MEEIRARWLPAAPPPEFLLYSARALRHFTEGALAVLMPAYLIALGFSAIEVGVISAAALLGSSALTITAGLLGNRFPLRTILLAFAGLMMVTGLALSWVRDFWPILFVCCLGTLNPGAGNNSVFVPMEHSALANAVPHEKRTMAFAIYSTSGAIALALGALSAGGADLLASSGMTFPEAVRTIFALYAVAGVAAAGIYSLLPLTKPSVEVVPQERPKALGKSKGVVYRLAALFALDSFGSGFAVQSMIALWLYEKFGMSVSSAGLYFSIAALLSAASLPVAGWLAKRFGLINTMVWSHVPAQIFLICAALSPTLTMTLAFMLMRALLNSMDTPARASYVMAVVDPEERPAASSLTNAPRSLAASLSPAFAGVLYATYGPAVPLIISAAIKLIYDYTLLMQFRALKPPEEQR